MTNGSSVSAEEQRTRASGWTLADSIGTRDREAEGLYSVGRACYVAGRYGQARDLFRLACLYAPTRPRYWFALGAACQLERSYEAALRAYAMTAILDARAPEPHLHAAECFILARRMREAKRAIASAIRHAEGRPSARSIVLRAQALARALSPTEGSEP